MRKSVLLLLAVFVILPTLALAQAIGVTPLSHPIQTVAADPASTSVWRDFFSALLAAALPLALAGATWVFHKLSQLIMAKVKNEKVAGILSRLDLLSESVVRKFMQTVVDDTRANVAGGKLPPEIVAKLKQDALDELKSHMGAQGLAELEQVLGLDGSGAVNNLLGTVIESAVHSVKQGDK